MDAAQLKALIEHVQSYEGVRETDGANRSELIDRINRWMGLPLGSLYCLSALLYVIHDFCTENGIKFNLPKCGSVQGFLHRVDPKLIFHDPKPGDIVLWSLPNGNHAGFVTAILEDGFMITSEANTSPGDGINRNGDGWYSRKRSTSVGKSFKILAFVRISDACTSA